MSCFALAFTVYGKIENCKHILLGCVLLLVYLALVAPWPIWGKSLKELGRGLLLDVQLLEEGELARLNGANYTLCDYDWCDLTTRVPYWLFVSAFVILIGRAFSSLG